MKTKINKHRFIVTVKTAGFKRDAKLAIISAFAQRQPDGCEFTIAGVQPNPPRRTADPLMNG
jgi:hypothetical protein